MPSLFEMEDFLKGVLEAKNKNKMALSEQQNKALMDRLKVAQAGETERTWRSNLTARDIAERRQVGSIKKAKIEQTGATTRRNLIERGLRTRQSSENTALMDRLKAKFNFDIPTRNENILSSIADRDRKAFDLYTDQSRKALEDKTLQIGVSEADRMAQSNTIADYTKRIDDLFQRMPLKVNQVQAQIAPLKAPGTLLQPNGRRRIPKTKGVDLFGFYKDANPFIDMSQYLR